MKRPSSLLLLVLLFLGDQLDAAAYRSPMQMQQFRQRFPRGDSYLAYNIHKTFKPRDVNELNSNQARKAMVDVQQTIAEVQRLLAQDPSLPRLTRGEIEELFENVTREELAKSLREGDHTRAQHMRALMLVLPYHTNNMNAENLQNIYTLPPVTQVVANEVPARKPPTQALAGPTVITPVRQTTTTAKPVFRQRSTTEARKPFTTTAVPITTIRFTTHRPTTFHPALPNSIREETKPTQVKEEPVFSERPLYVAEPIIQTTEPIATTTELVQEDLPVTTVQPTNAELNEILASIGFGDGIPPSFRPLPLEMTTPFGMATTTSTTESSDSQEDRRVDDELRMLLRSFGLLKDGEENVGISPLPSIDLELPQSLTDVQPAHLIQSEDLKVEEPEPEVPFMFSPDTKADDFVAFKPLPSDMPKLDDDLDQLLKSFGLLDNLGRDKKSMSTERTPKSAEMEEMPMIDKDLVPQMASVLDTLGIQTTKKERSGRKFETKKEANGVEQKSNGVGFKSKKKSENEDYKKLEQLWETIRELEKLNTNLTEDSLDALNLKNFNLSESLLAQGPNPLESFELKGVRTNDIKKRQQPSEAKTEDTPTKISLNLEKKEDTPTRISLDLGTPNTTTSNNASFSIEIISTTNNQPESTILDVESEADAPSSTTTTTESATSSESARLSALEDSFGGGADPVAQEPLPQPRRNGFYFLADWNSFLEVGEDPNKVVISFRPQAGDPSRFLPVSVP